MADSVRGAPSPPAAACGDNGHGGQVRRLRETLWDSETKRLELERKMLEYTICDTRTTKMKYRNLKKYLEEICERQKKSLLRNQDLLKEFDCIEAQIQKFASRSESLQRLKAEYEGGFKREQIPERKNISKSNKNVMKHQMVPEVRQTGINSRTAMSRGLYHTATIFMGRQMSAVSSVEDFSVPPKSSELTKSFSISDPHSHRQPSQSSYVTDSCVVQTNSDLQRSNKSDKIDGKTYLLMGKETPVTSSVSYENERTCCLTVESKTNNCSSNFVESKMSPELNSLLHGRLSPENRTTDFKSDSSCKSLEEILTHEYSVRNEQGSKRPILLVCRPEQLVSGNEHSRAKFPVSVTVPDDSLMLDKNAQEKEGESSGGSSDLTVSFSEEDEEGKPLKLQDFGCSTPYNEEEHPCSQALCHYSSSGGSSASLTIRKSLTFEGFAHVLTFIEQFVATADQEHLMLYQRKAVNAVELETLISVCNEIGSLKPEDLEVCEALVLHHLERLLKFTIDKCLLPEKTLKYKSGTLDEKHDRSELTSYFAKTWKRLSEHILLLKKYNVLFEQEVKDMLSTILTLESHEQCGLATSLLKESFSVEYEDSSLACSDKTSCDLQTNNSTIKQGRYEQRLGNNVEREKEVTSWCEDESKEESLVEKIPITALNIDSSSLKEQKSNGTSSEPSASSLERRSPLSRDENQMGMASTIKSKAFWGDSDDSNSEIEEALRPQVHSSQKDEFDDFYD